MGGFLKLVLVGALAFGVLAAWKYIFSPAVDIASKNTPYAIGDNDHMQGHPDAPVTVIEYTDFQCPACGAYYPIVKQLLQDMEGKFALVIRHYPLVQIHSNALGAARAAEAAARQGKFFEMYDMLFSKQSEWSAAAEPHASIFPAYAGRIGLDVDRYRTDVADASIDDKINQDKASGNGLGVAGTPTFYVNGEKIANPKSLEDFRTLLEAAVLKAPVVKKDAASASAAVHEHIDLKVFLNDKPVDFSQPKYQSTLGGAELDAFTHLHDGNGSVVHKHKAGITLGYFFKTLGIDFTQECFQFIGGDGFCNENGKTLKFFVNGQPSGAFNEYELHDLDRILISYGNESDTVIGAQIDAVSADACIYSEKCPERGKPPVENCAGGLGTDCIQQ